MSKTKNWSVAAIAVSLALASCTKKAAQPAASDEEAILQNALFVQGGVEQLKSGSSFSARYQGSLFGSPISGTMKHKAGATRLDYVDKLSKNPVAQVAAPGHCWQRFGRAVLPCHEKLAAHTRRLAKLLEASWLWPLKDRKYRFKVEPAEIAGKAYHGLAIEDAGTTLGTLLLDKSSALVVGLKMETSLGGKTGELVGTFSDFEPHCGVKIPTKRTYEFSGEPLSEEKIAGVICKAPEDKEFERPPQVEHGTVEIRHTFDAPLACTKLAGPLSGVSAAMNKVLGFLAQHKLPAAGAAHLIHRKGPPKVKQPKKYVTDVCFPVSRKAWVLPKSVWKGEFFLDQIAGDEVLAAFGIGDLEKTTTELPKLLLDAAKKKGRSQAGSMAQIVYMRAEDFPTEKPVTEMHLPLD